MHVFQIAVHTLWVDEASWQRMEGVTLRQVEFFQADQAGEAGGQVHQLAATAEIQSAQLAQVAKAVW